jgi:hypothetical protein
MILRFDIGSARVYFMRENDRRALPTDGPCFPWLLDSDPIQETARTPNLTGFAAWQTPSWVARLSNQDGQAQAILGNAMRAPGAAIDEDDTVLFDGLVAQVEFGLELAVTIEG